MKQRLADALRSARADFTDIRLERTWASAVACRGSRMEGATSGTEVGGIVRCLNRGKGWGIASFTGLDQLPGMVARAHELSLALPQDAPIRLAEIPVREADFPCDLDGDVRDVPLAAKRELLERLNQEMLSTDRRLVDARASYEDHVTERWVATSAGVLLSDTRTEVRLATGVIAREENFLERAFESWSVRGGWLGVQESDHLFRTAGRRAIALLGAPRVKAGTYPVVLDPRAVTALVHQAIGHLSEADTLLARPDLEERLPMGRRIGSDLLTIGDDGSAVGLSGSLAFDDEGAPTQNTLLVQHGVVVGRLHTRETAGRAGIPSTGNARAASFRRPPSARVTNTYLSNGQGTLDELVRPIQYGLYCCGALGGDVHHGRFTLIAAYGQLIRDGRLAEMVRPLVLTGEVTEVLGRVDAVAGDFRWNLQAARCGRPGASRIPVADGAPHVRIDGVSVRGDTV